MENIVVFLVAAAGIAAICMSAYYEFIVIPKRIRQTYARDAARFEALTGQPNRRSFRGSKLDRRA